MGTVDVTSQFVLIITIYFRTGLWTGLVHITDDLDISMFTPFFDRSVS